MNRAGRGPVLLPDPVGRPRRVRRAVPEEPLADPARAAGRRPVLDVQLWTPRFHGDGRADWDVLVSITYRDWAAMEEHSGGRDRGAPVPGPGGVRAEEQHRFELLEAHWDVVLEPRPLDPSK